jgi:hypothetical protein
MERLRAYCDRVKEAFESYVGGGWGIPIHQFDEDDRGRPVERRAEDHTDRSERSTSSSPSPSPTRSSASSEDGLRTPSEEKQLTFQPNAIQIDEQPGFDLDAMDVDIKFDEAATERQSLTA